MFKKGDILRAYQKNSVKSTNLYSAYNISSSLLSNTLFKETDLIKSIPSGNVFGIVQGLDTVRNVAYCTLSIQVFNKLGKRITHCFVDLSGCEKIEAITSNGSIYYATQDVNIRNFSGTLGSIRTSAKKGDKLGYSDGFADKNGFCRFQLSIGGIGYISKKYITKIEPTADKKTVRNTDGTISEKTDIKYNSNTKILAGLGLITLGFLGYYLNKKNGK